MYGIEKKTPFWLVFQAKISGKAQQHGSNLAYI